MPKIDSKTRKLLLDLLPAPAWNLMAGFFFRDDRVPFAPSAARDVVQVQEFFTDLMTHPDFQTIFQREIQARTQTAPRVLPQEPTEEAQAPDSPAKKVAKKRRGRKTA